MSKEFKLFVHNKWIENCLEREAWGQPVIKKAEYAKTNHDWLANAYLAEKFANKEWKYVKP